MRLGFQNGRTGKQKVIVPKSMSDQAIHHKINGTVKYISFSVCVSAAGETLIPYLVTSQDSMHLRETLKKGDGRFGTESVLKAREKAYLNTEIFLGHIRMVFMPNLNEQFADEDAVLSMDNCPSHVDEEVSTILRDVRVRIITWPPHTTHVFQELDLCLFGVLKRSGQYILPFDDNQTTADFFLKIDRMFRQTMTEPNIWGAFQEAGFEFDTSREPCRLAFNEEKC
jgi:hypothetical protein